MSSGNTWSCSKVSDLFYDNLQFVRLRAGSLKKTPKYKLFTIYDHVSQDYLLLIGFVDMIYNSTGTVHE